MIKMKRIILSIIYCIISIAMTTIIMLNISRELDKKVVYCYKIFTLEFAVCTGEKEDNLRKPNIFAGYVRDWQNGSGPLIPVIDRVSFSPLEMFLLKYRKDIRSRVINAVIRRPQT